LTQKPLKWNIELVNLDIRACNKMFVWAADYHSHSIMNNNWKPLKTLFRQCYQLFDLNFYSKETIYQFECSQLLACLYLVNKLLQHKFGVNTILVNQTEHKSVYQKIRISNHRYK